MSAWTDLVTTALLGTGRRELPPELAAGTGGPAEPAGWATAGDGSADQPAELRVLDLAAAHRVASRAGWRGPTPSGSPSGSPSGAARPAPAQTLRPAPPAARELLGVFLTRADQTAIELWLRACVRHGRGVAAEHWAPLVALRSRTRTYDRRLLATALGERGRWFVHQNPDWAELAAALDRAAGTDGGDRDDLLPAAGPTPTQVRADPELLLSTADPWPDDAVRAAYAGLVDGRMGNRTRSAGRALGSRLTGPQYAALGVEARGQLERPALNPMARREVRRLFTEIERAGFERVEIERAFDPSVARVVRVTIPKV